jgi:hypothetical protein
VQSRAPNLQAHLGDLESSKDFKIKYQKEGERLMQEFDTWALKEPRKNMGYIAEHVELGRPDSPAYKEVSAALKTQLTNVATAISTTQKT